MNQSSELTAAMKREWDARAREDAKWFINTLRRQQSDEEFDETGRTHLAWFITADLARLTQGRNPKELRLLEIGCGVGRMSQFLAAVFGEVQATDVSGEMIRQARARFSHYPNLRFHETDGVSFPQFADNYFDIIFSVHVFQHIPQPELVRANIRNAFRTLKPGGVFKFQVNSTANADYERRQKDTWDGAAFTESNIRDLARALPAQLISVAGAGTYECWTLLRKRRRPPPTAATLIKLHPGLKGFYFDQAAEPYLQGAHRDPARSFLALLAAGLSGHELDANQLCVELAGSELWPCYVTEVSRTHEAVSKAGLAHCVEPLTLVYVEAPRSAAGAATEVKVKLRAEKSSAPLAVKLPLPARPAPKIHQVFNDVDNGADLYASGPKAQARVLVEGLDETASVGNVVIKVGEADIQPLDVEYIPAYGWHHVKFRLPLSIDPGQTALQIEFAGQRSPSLPLVIS